MQLTSVNLNEILDGLRDAMPLIRRICKYENSAQLNTVVNWIDVFLTDPVAAEDELLGSNGDNVRAGLKAVLSWIPNMVGFALVREFIAYIIAQPEPAMKSVQAAK